MYEFDPIWWPLVVERQTQVLAESARERLVRPARTSLQLGAAVARLLRQIADRIESIPRANDRANSEIGNALESVRVSAEE